MTEEAIARLQASFAQIAREPHAVSSRFYQELFRSAPPLRRLFPPELTAQQAHFDAALALVIRNLREVDALEPALRDLGAQHIGFGAQPQHYLIAREALIEAIRQLSPIWDPTLERDWRAAISAIITPMLRGAAIATAMMAERLDGDEVK